MSPDRSGRGLWERVRQILGVPSADDEDLASAPHVTSTFTAHRFPSGRGPLSGPLFPAERERSGKWELYEDGWKQTEVNRSQEPRPDPDRDGWAPDDRGPGHARDVAGPRDPAAHPGEQRDSAGEPGSPLPRPVPAAEQHRHDDHPQELLRAEPEPPANVGPDELSATLEAWAADGDPAGLLAHVDDDEADALARAFGFDELPRRRPAGPDEPPGARAQETPPTAPAQEPEAPPPAPHADEDRPSEPSPVAPLTGAQPAWEPGPEEVVRPPGPITRDTGAERQVEVHEERVAQAQGRARRAPRPGISVHDAHLERPTGPVTLTPSEAIALAERGRDAIGPRSDVGPAN